MKVLAIFAALVAAVYCSGDDYTVIDHCYPFEATVQMYAVNGSKLLKQAGETWIDVTHTPCVTQGEDGWFKLKCDIDFAIYKVQTSDEIVKELTDAEPEEEEEEELDSDGNKIVYADYDEGDVYNHQYIVQCSEYCFSNITDSKVFNLQVPQTTDDAVFYYLAHKNMSYAEFDVATKNRTSSSPQIVWTGDKLRIKAGRNDGVYYWVAEYRTNMTVWTAQDTTETKEYSIQRVKSIFHINKGQKSRSYSCYPNMAPQNVIQLCKNAELVEETADTDSVTATAQ